MQPSLGEFTMKATLACEALMSGQRLALTYLGKHRLVEVHIVGHSRDGALLMRVWQVRGGSNGGQATGWKMIRLAAAASTQLLPEKSDAPRPDYNPRDPVIVRVICQL
jgi:hypothetical protein